MKVDEIFEVFFRKKLLLIDIAVRENDERGKKKGRMEMKYEIRKNRSFKGDLC